MKPITKEERAFVYTQSPNVSAVAGLIGYLRADMDTDGFGFFSTWFDGNPDLNTQDFKREIDRVINNLRRKGEVLENRNAIGKYYYTHPECTIESERNEFGIRFDTVKYSYLMRMNPNRGDYNLYCYCYVRKMLDDYITHALRGITFVNCEGEPLFVANNDDELIITAPNGEIRHQECLYIDDTHFYTDYKVYQNREFAEKMKNENCTFRARKKNED